MSGTKRAAAKAVYVRLCKEVNGYKIGAMTLDSLKSIRDPNYKVAVNSGNGKAKSYLYKYLFTKEELVNYLNRLPKLNACLGYQNKDKVEADVFSYVDYKPDIIESFADALLNGYDFNTFGIFHGDLRTASNEAIAAVTDDNVIGQAVVNELHNTLSADLTAINELGDLAYAGVNPDAADPAKIELDSAVACSQDQQRLVVRRLLRSPGISELLKFYNENTEYKNKNIGVDTLIDQATFVGDDKPFTQDKINAFKEIIQKINQNERISPAASLPSTAMFLRFVHIACKHLTNVNTKMEANNEKLITKSKTAVPNTYSYFATRLMSNGSKLSKFIHPFKYVNRLAAADVLDADGMVLKLRENANNLSVGVDLIKTFINIIIGYLNTKNVKLEKTIVDALIPDVAVTTKYKTFVAAKPSDVYNALFVPNDAKEEAKLKAGKNSLDLVTHIVKFAVLHQIIDALFIKKLIEKNIIAKRNEVIIENTVTFSK
jgi:hypothetical protein